MNCRTSSRSLSRPGFVLLLVVSSLSMLHCSRAVERRSEPTPAALATSPELEMRKRYLAASREIGCMTRKETDPNRIAAQTLAIYRRHGFEDVMSYLALMDTVGKDRAVQQELAESLKSCP